MKLGDVVRYFGFGKEKGPKKILVVDDGASSLNGVLGELRSNGYQIGFDGGCRNYDIVLVDVDVDDGINFLKKTRKINNDVPIVAVAEQDDLKIFRAYKDGADYCLTRPVKPQDALNIVNYLIGDLTEEEKGKLESIL